MQATLTVTKADKLEPQKSRGIIGGSNTKVLEVSKVEGGHMVTTEKYGKTFAPEGTIFNVVVDGN